MTNAARDWSAYIWATSPIGNARPASSIAATRRLHAAYQRSVEPYQIVHTGRRWYLVARDRDRQAWRTFRVDRIAEPVLTGQRYVLEESPPDPVALVAEGTNVVPWPIKARILLSATPEEAARLFPPKVGVLEPAGPTSTLLRVAAEDLHPLVQFAAGIPCDFEVLEPPELREALRTQGERLVRRHR
jgi:predicted DNA-binding transcriptional regulator YafY